MTLIPARWAFRDKATRMAHIATWAQAHGYRLVARGRFNLYLEKIT